MRNVLCGAILMALGAREASATPAWCNVDNKEAIKSSKTNVDFALSSEWENALNGLVFATCAPDNEAQKRAGEVEAARQAWSKKLNLKEADWADIADWAATGQRFSTSLTDLAAERKQHYAWSKLTPIEQFIAVNTGIGTVGAGNGNSDIEYLLDALGPKLSETGRFAFVLGCTRTEDPVWLAVCAGESERLDRAKVLDEVRAANGSGSIKTRIRVLLSELDGNLAKQRERVKKWRDKDPAYAKMFDIAAATRSDWDKIWQTESSLVDLALAMDDARELKSKSALDGCADKTRAAWREVVAAIPAKQLVGTDPADWYFDALRTILRTPRGYLAGVALDACFATHYDDERVAAGVGGILYQDVGLRGPRTATLSALLGAGLTLDEIGAKIKFPSLRHDGRFKGDNLHGYFGTVAKLSKPGKDGMVTITFAKKAQKQEQCTETRPAKRPSGIRADGSLIYDSDCVKWGIVEIDRTPDDQQVRARYLEGVKAGVSVYAGTGVVMGVFAKGKKTPIAVMGVPVK